jgi:hypothetical protein
MRRAAAASRVDKLVHIRRDSRSLVNGASTASSSPASAPDEDGPARLFGRGGNSSGGNERNASIHLDPATLDPPSLRLNL